MPSQMARKLQDSKTARAVRGLGRLQLVLPATACQRVENYEWRRQLFRELRGGYDGGLSVMGEVRACRCVKGTRQVV